MALNGPVPGTDPNAAPSPIDITVPGASGEDFGYSGVNGWDDTTFLQAALGWDRKTGLTPSGTATQGLAMGYGSLGRQDLSRKVTVDFSNLADGGGGILGMLPPAGNQPGNSVHVDGQTIPGTTPNPNVRQLTLAEALAAPFYEGSSNITALQSRLVAAGFLDAGAAGNTGTKGGKVYMTGVYDQATKDAYSKLLLDAADAGPNRTVDDILNQRAMENSAAAAGGKITRMHGDSTTIPYDTTGATTLTVEAKKEETDKLGAQLGAADNAALVTGVQNQEKANQWPLVESQLAKNAENRTTNNTFSTGANNPTAPGSVAAPFDSFDPVADNRRVDNGWDLQTAANTPVKAGISGVIVNHSDPSGYGQNYPVIMYDTPQGKRLGVFYGHISSDMPDGTRVKVGDVIGHTLNGGPAAGNASNLPGWVEVGYWGANGPTGSGAGTAEGEAMKGAILNGRTDVPTIKDGGGAGSDDNGGDIPPSFVDAIGGQENAGGDPTKSNPATGAHGNYQIMPANWGPWAAEAGIPGADPNDPAAQKQVATFKLNQYFHEFGGNLRKVAAAWYGGEGSADKNTDTAPQPNGPSFNDYVNGVLSKMGGAGPDPTGGGTDPSAPGGSPSGFTDSSGNQLVDRYVGTDAVVNKPTDNPTDLIDAQMQKDHPTVYDAGKLDAQFQSFLNLMGSAAGSKAGG